jgi:hypothetical protein
MPSVQGLGLVCAHHQEQLGRWIFLGQLAQSFRGVGRACAPDLSVIDPGLGQVMKGQTRHGQTVMGWGQGSVLMPGLTGWENQQAV